MTKRVLNATELKKIAEAADGQRGRPLQLMELMKPSVATGAETPTQSNTKYRIVDPARQRPNTPLSEWAPVLDVRTEYSNPGRASVTVRPTELLLSNGTVIPLDCPGYDAMFWSESSVEKFFFPYYVRILDPIDFMFLYLAFYYGKEDQTIYGFIHYPPTDPEAIDLDMSLGTGTVKIVSVNGLQSISAFVAFLKATFSLDSVKDL